MAPPEPWGSVASDTATPVASDSATGGTSMDTSTIRRGIYNTCGPWQTTLHSLRWGGRENRTIRMATTPSRFAWKRHYSSTSFQSARVSLVRDDVHRWLVLASASSCIAVGRYDLLRTVVFAATVCYAGWQGMGVKLESWQRWGVDVTLATYCASVFIWLAAAALATVVVTCCGLLEGGLNEKAVMTATVAIGVGAQPILNNFAAGLLLVLFRPFRIRDSVTACGHTFEVSLYSDSYALPIFIDSFANFLLFSNMFPRKLL